MFDVAIIGCGPVGALAGILLGKAGLAVLVAEQEAEPFPLPRAVHLDHEIMRLLQSVDVLEGLLESMRDTDGHLHVGADHGVIRFMGTAGRPRPFGWSNDYFFYQPELESALRAALEKIPNAELRLGTKLIDLNVADPEVVSLRFRSAGQNTEVQSRWVIACDGARSMVRKQLDIALDDLNFEEPWLVVDADVEEPVRFPNITGVPERADIQKLSVMMCDPQRPATIVPGRGAHRRWEFMLLPGESDAEMMQPARVAELVRPWLQGVTHTITRAATYRFHGLIAEQWRVGRVFLAGDAAHQTPPFFGQGMCHGMRDVANLAWKLALVVCERAPSALLDTYQEERDPHVRSVISSAVSAGRYICMLDPAMAAERDREMRERSQQANPSSATDLIPAIASGVVAKENVGAGERFIQPRVVLAPAFRLLDDETGGGWRLFVRGGEILHARRLVTSLSLPVEISVHDVDDLGDGGAVHEWLEARSVSAVLVRPDFYVFGTSKNDLSTLLDPLAEMLGALSARERDAA